MSVSSGVVKAFDDWVDRHADPSVKKWPLMDSISPAISIAATYLLFLAIGSRMMEARRPFELRHFMIAYNLAISLFSLYMVYEYAVSAFMSPKFKMSCFPVYREDNTNENAYRLRRVSWLYFISKIIELTDTVIFVLRKKQNQVTFLHVYHHTNLLIGGWLGVKFVPTGETYFLAMVNCSVHVAMYMYYALSAAGDTFRPYLWWKRYLTQFQLIQFVTIMAHYIHVFFANDASTCDFPRSVLVAYCLNGLSFLLLFAHFYRLAYKGQKQQRSFGSVIAGIKNKGE